jgi:hypothetical protein
MTDLKKRLAELKKRCAAHNRQKDMPAWLFPTA